MSEALLGDRAATGEAPDLRSLRHELRNAISAASVHLDLLSEEQAQAGSRERIDAVRDALAQALGLSDRLEGAGDASATGDAELASLVRQCARLTQPTIERSGRLRVDVPQQIGHVALSWVEGRELVMNLLLNAGQALDEDGEVSVSCRVRRGGRIAELTVADDGIGMPRHVLTRALLPGFTSRPHGTGLGLPRVSELVAKAKGSLHIRSAEGKGTRIVVRLPLIAPVAIA